MKDIAAALIFRDDAMRKHILERQVEAAFIVCNGVCQTILGLNAGIKEGAFCIGNRAVSRGILSDYKTAVRLRDVNGRTNRHFLAVITRTVVLVFVRYIYNERIVADRYNPGKSIGRKR